MNGLKKNSSFYSYNNLNISKDYLTGTYILYLTSKNQYEKDLYEYFKKEHIIFKSKNELISNLYNFHNNYNYNNYNAEIKLSHKNTIYQYQDYIIRRNGNYWFAYLSESEYQKRFINKKSKKSLSKNLLNKKSKRKQNKIIQKNVDTGYYLYHAKSFFSENKTIKEAIKNNKIILAQYL